MKRPAGRSWLLLLAALFAALFAIACGAAAPEGTAPSSSDSAVAEAQALYRRCTGSEPLACAHLAAVFEREPALVIVMGPSVRPLLHHFCGSLYPERPATCAAAAFHARACDGGVAAACGAFASFVADGDAGLARKLRHAACVGGDLPSCERLAHELVVGAHGVPSDPTRARALLARACEADSVAGCVALADLYAHGRGGPVEPGKARALMQRACGAGAGDACFAHARMAALGIGGSASDDEALALLRRACELESADGCVALARRVEHGRGVAADPALAYDHYRAAAQISEPRCEAGDASACHRLGVLLREGSGVAQDRARGLLILERACVAGHAAACMAFMTRGAHFVASEASRAGLFAMTGACRRGDGGACFVLGRVAAERDRGQGAELFARGCVLGHAASCNAAGVGRFPPDRDGRAALERGCAIGDAPACHHLALALEVAAEESERAVDLHRTACGRGLASACTRLGELRALGIVGGVNMEAAHLLFERACTMGDARGCLALGELLIMATGSGRDQQRGAELIERACKNDAPRACATLGEALLRGRDVPRDPSRAAALLDGACERGQARACLTWSEALRRGHGVPRDEARAKALLASEGPARSCAQQIAVCHSGAQATVVRTWSTWDEAPFIAVAGAPSCDMALERVCNDAREMTVARCELSDEGCPHAAELLSTMAAVGLGVSRTQRDAVDKRAFDVVRRACDRGDAPACLAVADAHERGVGAKRDDNAAKRARRDACRLDAATCR